MTKFYDNNKLLAISMTDTNTGCDWEYDFFETSTLTYNEELDAYKVDDVQYLADFAESYADGTNTDCEYDYDDDGNKILPATTVEYNITNI